MELKLNSFIYLIVLGIEPAFSQKTSSNNAQEISGVSPQNNQGQLYQGSQYDQFLQTGSHPYSQYRQSFPVVNPYYTHPYNNPTYSSRYSNGFNPQNPSFDSFRSPYSGSSRVHNDNKMAEEYIPQNQDFEKSNILTPPTAFPIGSCGPDYGNTKCPLIGGVQSCCSAHGFCGTTKDHCHVSAGCLGQCWEDVTPLKFSLNGKCAHENNNLPCDPESSYGPCCSRYGFCGITDDHCYKRYGCISGCKD